MQKPTITNYGTVARWALGAQKMGLSIAFIAYFVAGFNGNITCCRCHEYDFCCYSDFICTSE